MHWRNIVWYGIQKIRKQGVQVMLAKITTKNQITIPKKIIDQLPDVKYFDVELKEGLVLLKPLRVYNVNLEQIRSKLKKLGLKENSVKEAIQWARQK
jgi:bifunctional DNA-binding transcriptional regulator/antitoxin component of YhaV-PrlF toxin-antitoxin module